MNRRHLQGQHLKALPVSCAVVGLADFGERLALTLKERGCNVLGIDRDAVIVERLSSRIPCTVVDATDETALRRLEIANYDTVVVSSGADFELSVMTTVALTRSGARRLICLVGSESQGRILLRLGAQRVIEPQSDAGRRLAAELSESSTRQEMPFGPHHRVVCLQVTADQGGQNLGQLNLTKGNATVLMIQRDKQAIASPSGETTLREGDFVTVLGSKEAIAALHWP